MAEAEITLTDAERAKVLADREAHASEAFDIDQIRPGMSRDVVAKAKAAITKLWK